MFRVEHEIYNVEEMNSGGITVRISNTTEWGGFAMLIFQHSNQ